MKTVGGALKQVPFKWVVCFGVGKPDEGMCKRKDEESNVEREAHCLVEGTMNGSTG